MLSKQQCPYTGIVNYFTTKDPFISVGSIVQDGGRRNGFCWRWYDAASTISGIAADMKSAEERLESQYHKSAKRPH